MTRAVVATTYNEKGNIESFVKSVFAQLGKIPGTSYLVIVDGDSTDGTGQLVASLQSTYSLLKLFSFPKAGIGKAYNQSLPRVFAELNADEVVTMDADFSHDPKDLSKLIGALADGADLAIGSRYIAGGSIPAEWAWYRKVLSGAGNWIVRMSFGTWQIHEYTTAFRAFKRTLWDRLNKQRLQFDDNTFLPAFIYEASRLQASIVEVPVTFKDRIAGVSKIEITRYAPRLLKYAMLVLVHRLI